MCLGDSITYGFGVKRSDTWISLADEYLDHKIINKGINGDTTSGMISRFKYDVSDEKPDIVHIMGGANDILLSGKIDQAKNNIGAMVHQSHSMSILPIIGIPTPIQEDMVPDTWMNLNKSGEISIILEEYCRWIRLFADTFNIETIDYYREFGKGKLNSDMHKYYTDGIHLTSDGNKYFANIFIEKIRAITSV